MGSRLGFKIFVGLLVMISIITLIMVFGLERSYIEQLKEEHVSLEQLERHSFHESRPKRSPLELELETHKDDRMSPPNNFIKNGDKHNIVYEQKKQIHDKSIVVGPELYQVLKQRKVYELRIEKSMRESWWYIRKQLSTLLSDKVASNDLNLFITNTMDSMKDRHHALQKWHSELNADSDNPLGPGGDGALQPNWRYWQANVSADLRTLMQKRLHHLQNPPNCDSAKKLVCKVALPCGFGCQMSHVTYCFIMAYASGRTLILDSSGWRYNNKGWESVFQPITPCSAPKGNRTTWSLTATANTVSLPPLYSLSRSSRPPQLPMAVPNDIVDRLTAFHGFPFGWFACQFVSYLLRPSQNLQRYLQEKKESIGLQNKNRPIVGLHVRRTDKTSEARYHDIEEYMEQVDEWYGSYELMHKEEEVVIKRRVYIATDEPKVLKEASDKYPQYEIYSDSGITSLASKTSTRYSAESLYGVIFDVTMLSQCDYIVCTFSSQVCRLAYELMQDHHIDASNKYYSLDDVYYFGGQQGHDVVAIQDHEPPRDTYKKDEISFKVGDRLVLAGNEKDGYSVGRHTSTRQSGQYPSYKVEEHVYVADFPTYNNVHV